MAINCLQWIINFPLYSTIWGWLVFFIALLVIQHVILHEMLKYLLNAEKPL